MQLTDSEANVLAELLGALEATSYFVSRISIQPSRRPGMSRWRKRLFIGLAHNAANPAAYFMLPDERTVVMGTHIEL